MLTDPDGVLSGILYQLLNSIVESPIRKEIFITAERRQFMQVFYRGIAMLRTQKLWMLNTRLEGVLPFKTLHKGILLETNSWNLSHTFFLNYNCCCCFSTEDSTVVKTTIFKGPFWTCKTVLYFNSNEFYYFFVFVPLLCSLLSALIFLETTTRVYCSIIWQNAKVQ